MVVRASKPLVSFTFDDFPRSAHRVGGPILLAYGVRGTYYVAIGLRDTESERGRQFGADDLEAVAVDGHELGCHTFGHLDAHKTTAAHYEESLRQNRLHLQRLLPHVVFETFAYPFGRVTLGAKRVAGRSFACCRTTRPGINCGIIDLNVLRSNKLLSQQVGLDHICTVIACNARVNGWLIFHTHDVCEHPSPYGCTPEFLEGAVRCALESGAEVLPVKEALARLRSGYGASDSLRVA